MPAMGWVSATVLALALALGTTTPAVASHGRPEVEHCISPSGIDINAAWGVSNRIVAPFCPDALVGEKLSIPNLWLVNTTFEAVPPEFVPVGATPIDDFNAKFVGVRLELDRGTRLGRTFLVTPDQLGRRTIQGFPAVDTVGAPPLRPPSPGPHTMRTVWLFNGLHCDGFGADAFDNCFPAGETVFDDFAFTVRSRSSS